MTTAAPEVAPPSVARSRRSLRNATVGNVLEWYDWNVYAIFTPFFAPAVFHAQDSAGALLQSLVVFAVGFLTRPVGGLLLGRWGDRHGRRAALTLSMLLMAGGSLLIAACPTGTTVGWLAPLVVLVARLAQGVSAGGEFGTSSAYVVEIAPPRRKGLYSSVVYVSNAVGNLLAALLGVVLTASLTSEQMHSWGWRIPFLLGAGLAAYAYVLRRSLDESHRADGPLTARRGPSPATPARHRAALLRIGGYTLAGTVVYYTWVVFLPSYAAADGRISESSALVATTTAQLLFVVALPLAGMLADRVGARPLLLLFSGAFAVLTIPLLALAPRSFASLMLVQCAGLVIFCGYGATAPLIMAEQFPAHLRASGIGFPYGVTVSVFGGTAPYLAATAHHAGNAVAYSGYVAATAAISFLYFCGLRSAHPAERSVAADCHARDADAGRSPEAVPACE